MSDFASELHLRYLADAIMTATPAQRLLMLFDGFASDLSAADEGFATRDWKIVNDHLVHAQEILCALRDPLDAQSPLGSNLRSVYGFCLNELLRANLDKDPTRLPEVRRLVGQIADANRAALVHSESDLPVSA